MLEVEVLLLLRHMSRGMVDDNCIYLKENDHDNISD